MKINEFRAWDKLNKKMISHNELFRVDCSNEYPFLALLKNFYQEDLDVIVMQYTGLKDSKRTDEYPEGQKIFEGDITNRGFVEWWKGKFQVVNKNGQCYDDLCWCHHQIEVIGNIHKNPELLKT